MDGGLVTGMRTGAAGAISSRLLARDDASTLAVFGCGGQARMQVYAHCAVMDVRQVRVYTGRSAGLEQYRRDVEERTGVPVVACDSPEKAMENADIAISTTPSKQFFLGRELIRPGLHIVAVGADMAGKNEWDPEIFRNAKLVTDSTAQCVARGETRNAILRGVITEYGEIGELLLGHKPGRETRKEITIFDTIGMAIQDNAVAVRCYEAATRMELGDWFSFV